MPVWRYPISGTARATVSPSSSSKTRSTPCVEGCCGPILRTIVLAAPVAVSTLCDARVVVIIFLVLADTLPECHENLRPDSRGATDGPSIHLASESCASPGDH